ncbi:RWD domain-containing protein 4-like [Uloborus diversus]|uniref:RWD domain-containing protein 4-like n=1 Tax=Uloborus diversus TaxID=327109 RepID=UPI00240A8F6F|nr:RWD domain-containing protein 4-like [Uloborus diversus]
MTEWKELQEEELEVLDSIYDGDENFKKISSSSFRYKFGADDDPRSFLLEICWIDGYPNVPPKINLDAFYNNKLLPDVKKSIVDAILKEAEMHIGMPMTYTLIEWVKDCSEKLAESQPEKPVSPENTSPPEEKMIQEEMVSSSVKKEKKPKLSKQQKRKLAEKLDARGERPRGWDWVDVVKHLSQLGSKQADVPPSFS